MEFYNNIENVFIILKSFNSQRDGILRLRFSALARVYIEVSIPNGMEFYESEAKHAPLD